MINFKQIKDNKLIFISFFLIIFVSINFFFQNYKTKYKHIFTIELDNNISKFFNKQEKEKLSDSLEIILNKQKKNIIFFERETSEAHRMIFFDDKLIKKSFIENYIKNLEQIITDEFIQNLETFISKEKYEEKFYMKNYYLNIQYFNKKNDDLIKEYFKLKKKFLKKNYFSDKKNFGVPNNKEKTFTYKQYVNAIKKNQLFLKNFLNEIKIKNILDDETSKNLLLIENFQKRVINKISNENYSIILDNKNFVERIKNINELDFYINSYLFFINHEGILSREDISNKRKLVIYSNLTKKIKNYSIKNKIWKISFFKFERNGINNKLKISLFLIYSLLLSYLGLSFVKEFILRK